MLTRGNIYYLVDGASPPDLKGMKPTLAVVAHSPDPTKFKQFQSQVAGILMETQYMPPWEWDELLHLKQKLYPDIPDSEVFLTPLLVASRVSALAHPPS